MRSRWAWFALAVLGVLLAMTAVVALIVSPVPWVDDAVFVFTALAPLLVGAVLVARQPDNLVGKVLVLIGAAWSLGEAARVYLWMSLHLDLPWTGLPVWLMHWVFVPAWALIPVLLVVFPTGAVASSWLRWPLRVYIAFLVVWVAGAAVAPGDLGAYGEYLAGFTNPVQVESLSAAEIVDEIVEVISAVFVLGFGLVAVVDLIRRWRRSTGTERLQMRAFALGALVMVLLLALLAIGALIVAVGMENKVVENLTTTVAISAPPVAIGVAVLRYRLYEIDRLISRTVSYAVVVGALALVFAAIATVLPQLLGLPEDSPLLVAGATLAAAALFNPLRRRVQLRVDRRFNRARYDAQEEVNLLAERLRAAVEMEDLVDEMISVVSRMLQPAAATVWVKEDSR